MELLQSATPPISIEAVPASWSGLTTVSGLVSAVDLGAGVKASPELFDQLGNDPVAAQLIDDFNSKLGVVNDTAADGRSNR